MLKRRRIVAMLLSWSLLALGGCGSAGSPVGPTDADVSGVWTGTVTLQTARPLGNCVAVVLQATFPLEIAVQLTVTQNGSALSGPFTLSGPIEFEGEFTGTVTGNQVDVELMGSPGCNQVLCVFEGARLDCPAAASVNATINGPNLTGNYFQTDDTFVAGTNVPTGPITLEGRFTARR